MTDRVVGIIGTGSIGASIGLRVRRDGGRAIGYDTDPAALERALSVGAIDAAVTLEELYAHSGVVVIAPFVEATVNEIKQLRDRAPIGAALVVDVASVKAPIVAAARGLSNFVGTHPMAGSERSGPEAARAELFEARTWAYVPSGDERLDDRARAFIASLGGVPLAVDADEHDRIVAFSSHLPHLIAWSYLARSRQQRSNLLDPLCGATARELLRLGRSGFPMWHGILRANAANIEPELRALATSLLKTADDLHAGEIEAIGR